MQQPTRIQARLSTITATSSRNLAIRTLVALAIAVALPLAACTKATPSQSEAAKPSAPVVTGEQPVAIIVNDDGFSPSQVTFKRGGKATLQFRRTSDLTCAKQVVFPELGLTKELPLNQQVDIEVPLDQARTLTFQCGMGMYKSKVVVL
jgi:plastocyanin domain-containing protein